MKPRILLLEIFLTFFIGISAIHHKHYHRAPIIDLNGAEELIGTIREDERVVTVTPDLHILHTTGPVCHYELNPIEDTKEVPFEVRVLDNYKGTAQIHLRDGAEIDCSDVEFKMNLVAVRCADESAKSEPVLFKVTVQDVNNHAPEFDAPWYTFDIEEGKTVEVTKLFATDKDCGHPYGRICRYEITKAPENSPFHIDDQGVLSLVKPLNRSEVDSHILTVVAYDCGMLRSKSTLITVHVKPKCVDGIRLNTEIARPIAFAQGESSKSIFSGAEVTNCAHSCQVESTELIFEIENHTKPRHISSKSLKECQFDPESINLLPENHSIAAEQIVDSDESEDDEEIQNDGVFRFDGNTSLIVSQQTVKEVIPEKFNLLFSMKTTAGSEEEQGQKQNILCESDLHGLNRHHFGLYLRHCKLELLLRREPERASVEFRAAEWRWFDKRICDGKWHSYAIHFSDLDNVKLFIDGEVFNTTERNPEILDDWPLHITKEKKTQLVIGACWHGRTQKMVQFFKGELSSMFLLIGKSETESKTRCLHRTHERLIFGTGEQLAHGESATMNTDHSQLVLKANTMERLSALLQSVEYSSDPRYSENLQLNPTVQPGTRSVIVSGSISCKGENGTKFNRTLAQFKREIELKPQNPPKLSILISGQSIISTDRKTLKGGVALLPTVQIVVANEDHLLDASFLNYKLDWCTIHMTPARDMDLEFFSSPATLMASLNIDFVHDRQGIMLKGKETGESYSKILTKIHYFNTRPETYRKRMYALQCGISGLNVTSNKFIVTMDIISAKNPLNDAIKDLTSLNSKFDDEKTSPMLLPKAENSEGNELLGQKHLEPSEFDQIGSNRLQNILEMDLPRPKALHGYENKQTALAGGVIAIVVVVCVGMLLILLVIGVVKIRDDPIRRRSPSRQDSMLEWDDAGLNMNLTLNPLEGMGNGDNQLTGMQLVDEIEGDESCSEEDNESYRDELTDDEDEGETQTLHQNGEGLEWDDGGIQHNLNKSYRV